MNIYYSNKTVYLRDHEKYATGSFECVLVENDVLEKTTIPSNIELKSKYLIMQCQNCDRKLLYT